jgi:hypothetical protein
VGKGRKDSIASAATVAAGGNGDGGADAAEDAAADRTVDGPAPPLADSAGDATRSGEHIVKAPTDKPPAVGDLLGGRYQLLDELGHGTSGVVFRARDWVADEMVAIKVLVGKQGRGGVDLRRVRRELRVARKVSHPGVVRIHDLIDLGNNRMALSMELVDGETLYQRLRREPPLTPPEVAALASDLSRALAAAHRAGVVHRDLKPANIILRANGRAVITDFGISRLAEMADFERLPTSPAADVNLTSEGELLGTPLYMAPEQLEGQSNVGPSADVYALGLILYEAATGKPPHLARGIVELLSMRKREKTTSLAIAAPSLDRTLAALVDRCLAAEPERRFPSGAEVRAEIEPLFSRGERPVTPPRRRVALFAAVLVATIVLAAGATWLWRGMLPLGARRLAVVVDNDGAPADAWLATAAAHLIAQRLQHDEDRFSWAADPDGANVVAHLHLKTGDGVVTLSGTIGKVGGRVRALASAQAPTLRGALDQMLPPLRELVGGSRGARAPDDDERTAMRRLGTSSFAAFRLYRRSLDDQLRSVIVDETAGERDLEEVLRLDPNWLHPYLLLADVEGEGSPRAINTIERAARVGSSDDALGRRMLAAALVSLRGDRGAATATLDAALRDAPDDLLVGWLLSIQLRWRHESERAIAVLERMHAARPDLQFGSDLQAALRDAGRGDEAPAVQRAWLERAPESEQALAGNVTADLEAGRAEDAERHAQTIIYLHGDAPHRLALLCDVLIAIGKTRDARQIADRLLRGGPLDRVRGQLRSGEIAILEGRFGAAYDALSDAAVNARPFGIQGELQAILEQARTVAAVLGRTVDYERLSGDLASWLHDLDPPRATVVEFERALARRHGGACPDVAVFAAEITNGRDRQIGERDMLRAAAQDGCASCAQVVRAGLSADEMRTDSLYRFGLCAETEKALQLARDSFERIVRVRTAAYGDTIAASPYHSILARYHLGRVLARMGRNQQASEQLQDFYAHWVHSDRALPEVEAARAELERLQ